MDTTIVRRTLSAPSLSASVDALLAAGLPPVLARVYAARGIRGANELDHSLAALPAFGGLRGIDAAAARLVRAIETRERIVVVADYDADGATACAVAVRGLGALGANIDFIVPNRFEYGYGLTPEIVALAAQRAPDLLVTVDNGIASVEGVAAAAALGIDVLVTDHHLPGPVLPSPAIIVNPNQPGCTFASKHIAGVGVHVLRAHRDACGAAGPRRVRPAALPQPGRPPRPRRARHRGRRRAARPDQPRVRRAGPGPAAGGSRAAGRARAVRSGRARSAPRHGVRPGIRCRSAPERGRPAVRHVDRHSLPARDRRDRGLAARRGTRPAESRATRGRGNDAGAGTRRPGRLRRCAARRPVHGVPVPAGMASGGGGHRRVAAQGPVPPAGGGVRAGQRRRTAWFRPLDRRLPPARRAGSGRQAGARHDHALRRSRLRRGIDAPRSRRCPRSSGRSRRSPANSSRRPTSRVRAKPTARSGPANSRSRWPKRCASASGDRGSRPRRSTTRSRSGARASSAASTPSSCSSAPANGSPRSCSGTQTRCRPGSTRHSGRRSIAGRAPSRSN